MDALVEAIGAVLHFFVAVCVYIADMCIRTVLFFIDSCRYGYEGALKRSQQRQNDGVTPHATRIGGAIVFFGTIFISGTILHYWHQHHQKKVNATEQLVDRLAEKYYQQTNEPDPVFENGPLTELDAWGQPVRLDTEKSLMGWWIVVRSDGPDGRPATSDDVEAIRSNWANLEQVSGELASRGANKIKEKLKGMFGGGDDKDPPEPQDDQLNEEVVAKEEAPADNELAANNPADVEPAEEEKKGWKLPSLKLFDLRLNLWSRTIDEIRILVRIFHQVEELVAAVVVAIAHQLVAIGAIAAERSGGVVDHVVLGVDVIVPIVWGFSLE